MSTPSGPAADEGSAAVGVPAAVREAFGVSGRPEALAGGEGVSVRLGGVVLKRVHDVAEAEWTQDLLSRMDEDGFRLARPVPTLGGRWTHEGWSAARFVPGLRPLAPAWDAVAEAGRRFSEAAEAAGAARGRRAEALAARTHRWAVADRFAWGESGLDLGPEAAEVHARLRALLAARPAAGPAGRQVVHGDLTGNVFVDPSGVPVVLDVAPYLRPREWATAIVVADAVLWHGAELALARSYARTATARDHLARALIFRLAAEPLATGLEPYRRVLPALA